MAATTTNTDLGNLDQEDGGPGGVETETYSSCDEVPLPSIYDGLTFDPRPCGPPAYARCAPRSVRRWLRSIL